MIEVISLILEVSVFLLLMVIIKIHGKAIEQLQDDYKERLKERLKEVEK